MSLTSDYYKALEEEKKKKKNQVAVQTTKPKATLRPYESIVGTAGLGKKTTKVDDDDDIAPIRTKQEEERIGQTQSAKSRSALMEKREAEEEARYKKLEAERRKKQEEELLAQMTPTQRWHHERSGGFPDLSTPWNEQADAVTKMILEGTDTDYAQADKLMKQLQEQRRNLLLNDTAKVSEATELQGYYNQILVAKNAAILSKTKMDGSNKSVLQEMQELSGASGKEKKSRKEAVLKKMDELGIPRDQYALYTDDKNFEWGTFWDWAGNTTLAGLNSAWLGFAKTLNILTLQNPLTEKVVDFYEGSYNAYKHDADLAAEKLGGGGGWGFATDALEGTAGAVPSAVTAIMTLGGSATTDLATKAAYTVGTLWDKIGITASQILKNPNYWTSVARTLGSDY
jgi:hypothetical protein